MKTQQNGVEDKLIVVLLVLSCKKEIVITETCLQLLKNCFNIFYSRQPALLLQVPAFKLPEFWLNFCRRRKTVSDLRSGNRERSHQLGNREQPTARKTRTDPRKGDPTNPIRPTTPENRTRNSVRSAKPGTFRNSRNVKTAPTNSGILFRFLRHRPSSARKSPAEQTSWTISIRSPNRQQKVSNKKRK